MHLITVPKHMKQKVTKLEEEIDKSAPIVGDFNTP